MRIAGFLVAAPLLALLTVLTSDADGNFLLLAFGPALHPAFTLVVHAAHAALMRRPGAEADTMARASRAFLERGSALTSRLLEAARSQRACAPLARMRFRRDLGSSSQTLNESQ